jgi:hypothetical protein
MNRLLCYGLASLTFLALSASPSWAQYNPYSRPGQYGPYATPPVSPYLNLLPGNNPAVNYYLQVLPQLNRPYIEGGLESQIRGIQQATPQLINSEVENLLRSLNISEPLEGTGHAVRFGDTSPYFRGRLPAGQQTPGYRTGAVPGR